ncbi:hypothetical protein A45J_1793 [hot springs metagenome]|uniref:PIN domain-containing protein n=1 Tax=hot springs metagenome TaxID=433727 RepID=A0A5J4L1E8_9ZZZZ
MDKKKVNVFIDTNVFIIDLRYRNDGNFKTNRDFLDFIAKHGRGITSIVNLLEICGILSFNLNRQQIQELFYYLPEKYRIGIIPSHDMDSIFPETHIKAVMDIIYRKASLGDALIANIVNNYITGKAVFISWDAGHFKNLLSIEAITPHEFLLSI